MFYVTSILDRLFAAYASITADCEERWEEDWALGKGLAYWGMHDVLADAQTVFNILSPMGLEGDPDAEEACRELADAISSPLTWYREQTGEW